MVRRLARPARTSSTLLLESVEPDKTPVSHTNHLRRVLVRPCKLDLSLPAEIRCESDVTMVATTDEDARGADEDTLMSTRDPRVESAASAAPGVTSEGVLVSADMMLHNIAANRKT
jgi:hypothetical protein